MLSKKNLLIGLGGFIALFVVIGALAGSDEDEGDSSPEPPAIVADAPDATSSPTPEPEPEAVGTSQASPAPIGTVVETGGWEIVVVSIDPDATQAVLNENMFNDPPGDGSQFFFANVSATYRGDTEGQNLLLTSFRALGPSNVAITERCGVTPDQLDTFVDVFAGGTITGNLCFEVPSSDVDSLLMYVEKIGHDRVWFALHP